MGRLQAKSDYESVRKARIMENQNRLETLGLEKSISDLRSLVSSSNSPNTHVRNYTKKVYEIGSLRRSNRLNQISTETITPSSQRLQAKSDYESVRKARILENQNRLKTLGLEKSILDLRSIVSSLNSPKTHVRNYTKKVYEIGSLRRSNRLKQISTETITPEKTSLRRSDQFRENEKSREPVSAKKHIVEEGSPRPANMPLVMIKGSAKVQLSPEASALRCSSRDRGGVYDSVFGICCHFCRQKKLCGEEDCKRCSNLDVNEPCIGKTDCSVCHSTNGVFCRGCLKVRYGEEMEEVIRNKEWMCPHCIEEKGINPYWICNSSFCLRKRKMAPTGIAIFRAKELGYKSVAHLLMDQLQGEVKPRP